MRSAALLCVAMAAFYLPQPSSTLAVGQKKKGKATATLATPVVFTPFGEMNDKEPFNTSGVLHLEDGRFLLVDNKIDDAMLELRLDESGIKREPLVRRPLVGVAPGIVDDLEATTWVDGGDEPFVVATSSFNRKHGYDEKGRMVPTEGYADGLLRVRRGADGALTAEHVSGFRQWLVAAYRDVLGPVADKVPDEGGLNVEGLEWDPDRQALLFGVRSPLRDGRPMVLPVRLKNPAGAWSLDQFEALPSIVIPIEKSDIGSGVRSLGRPARLGGFLVVIGKGAEGRRVPFHVYHWDGKERARRLPELTFERRHRPEGVCVGTIGGRTAGVIVDDAGGYAVIWTDDPRIQALIGSAPVP